MEIVKDHLIYNVNGCLFPACKKAQAVLEYSLTYKLSQRWWTLTAEKDRVAIMYIYLCLKEIFI